MTACAYGFERCSGILSSTIATVVLVGLIHVICELHINDVCEYAQSKNEFMERLELVFARFEKHNIRLIPSKYIFDASEVKWLGRVINLEGISMSKEKMDSVFEFRMPTRYKELEKLYRAF